MNELLEYEKVRREIRDALSVSVKIDHEQILKVVVRDLIKKRKSSLTYNKDAVVHFDHVLKYYLGGEDFEKYVINEAEIEI